MSSERKAAEAKGALILGPKGTSHNGINATFLEQHFSASSQTENTRLAVMVSTLLSCTMQDTATACRDWSNAYKGKPSRKGIQNRCGEVKVLKAAMDAGFTVNSDIGWHGNISEARIRLAQLSLTDSGKPQVSKQERAAAAKFAAFAKASAKLAGNDVSKLQDVAEQAAENVQKDTAEKLARVVVQKHGLVIAEYCADALLRMIDDIQRGRWAAEQADAVTQDTQDAETVEAPDQARAA